MFVCISVQNENKDKCKLYADPTDYKAQHEMGSLAEIVKQAKLQPAINQRHVCSRPSVNTAILVNDCYYCDFLMLTKICSWRKVPPDSDKSVENVRVDVWLGYEQRMNYLLVMIQNLERFSDWL